MIHAPELLNEHHQTADFDCGEAVLNHWLQKMALKNQYNHASRTFVVCNQHQQVLGFYALAAGSVTHSLAIGSLRRNMPDPVPVVVLGRLAVDKSMQGQHLGVALLKDAVLRSQNVAEQIGVKALLVHALNESARDFYLRYGFSVSPIDDWVLMLKL